MLQEFRSRRALRRGHRPAPRGPQVIAGRSWSSNTVTSAILWLLIALAAAFLYQGGFVLRLPQIGGGTTVAAVFSLCDSGGTSYCVIDGDTFRYRGERIRLLDIDAPETHPPRCAYERDLGGRATRRLHELLNQGPFALHAGFRDEDRYGRKLRTVTRDGESIGAISSFRKAWRALRRWTAAVVLSLATR